MEIGIFVSCFAALATSLVILVTRAVGRASQESNIKYHTKENYSKMMVEHFGEPKLTLYSELGDALDQKSGWQKGMDIIFDVLDNNPDLILDYLVDRYGIVDVRNTLALMDEVDGDV